MRQLTITLCLLILCVFCSKIGWPLTEGQSMKQKRYNALKRLCFIPQRDLIVGTCSSEPNGSVRFWSIDQGNLKEVFDLGRGEWASSLAVSNGGDLIAIALLRENETGCYSLKERKWLWKVNWVEKATVGNAMRFTPDDRKLVVVGFRNIVTYDARTGAVFQNQEDSRGFSGGFPNYRAEIAALSPSARYAAIWLGNPEAHDETWWSLRNIWVLVRDIEIGKTIAKQGKVQERYKNCSAVFTPDEKNLLLGSMDGYVRVWSIGDQKVIRGWKAYWDDESGGFGKDVNHRFIQAMTFSSDGRYLATLGLLRGRLIIRIWEPSSGKLIHQLPDVGNLPSAMCSGYPMAFTPDGKYFALEQQGNLCLYETQTWGEKWCVPSWPEDKPRKVP
jgi:WD40 repeat protein